MRKQVLLSSLACLAIGFGLGKYEPYTAEGYHQIINSTRKALAKTGELPTKAIPFKAANRFGRTMTVGHTPWRDGEALMVLHIWGPWCAPCREEFPSLVEFAEANPDVYFITVSVGSEMKYVDSFLESIHFKEEYSKRKLLALVGSEKESTFADDYYQVDVFPTTIFLDKEGNIVERFRGIVDWQSPKTQKILDTLKGTVPSK